MKKPLYSLLAIWLMASCSFPTSGQEIHTSKTKYTGHVDELQFWGQRRTFLVSGTDLDPVTESVSPFHFRLWLDGQVIDIMKDDRGIHTGTLVQYTQDMHNSEDSFSARLYTESTNLNEPDAKRVYDVIQSSILTELDRQEDLHGSIIDDIEISYVIELSDHGKYVIKDYWDPLTYEASGNEARMLFSFVDSVSGILNLDAVYQAFIGRLTNGCYHTSSYILWCNVGSEMKLLTGNDPGGIQDEVMEYLSTQAGKFETTEDDWVWYGYADLFFSKNGKFKDAGLRTIGGYALESYWYSKKMQKLQAYVKKTARDLDLSHLQPDSQFETRLALRYDSATDILSWGKR